MKAKKNKDTSIEARKLAEKRNRETEVEKNRQNWRNILPEEECYPDPRNEVIEIDEDRNA